MPIGPLNKRYIPAIAWFFLTLYLLTLPGSAFPKEDWFEKIQLDKWVHIALFVTLTTLCYMPFLPIQSPSFLGWPAVLIALSILAYGIIMEFVQKYLIPFRSFDIGDIAADGMGCLMGYIALRWKCRTSA
jgi:VanZ family protein